VDASPTLVHPRRATKTAEHEPDTNQMDGADSPVAARVLYLGGMAIIVPRLRQNLAAAGDLRMASTIVQHRSDFNHGVGVSVAPRCHHPRDLLDPGGGEEALEAADLERDGTIVPADCFRSGTT